HEFRAILRAPGVGVGQEKFLPRRPAISFFGGDGLVLRLKLARQRHHGQSQAAVVGRVLALGQVAVRFDSSLGYFFGIFVGDAISTLFVGFGIRWRPPVTKISLGVEFTAFIVKAV